uniref:Uncharacterized protein n=1 Tax=Arundo donax TaxID=35708 RepID=A0A0A8Y2R8_ARUDO
MYEMYVYHLKQCMLQSEIRSGRLLILISIFPLSTYESMRG